MAMGTISGFYPNGRPSGLPDDFVDQLVSVKQKQLEAPLQSKVDDVMAKRDIYTKLNSSVGNLAQSISSLTENDAFQGYTATSSNPDTVTAKASSNAQPGLHTVNVTQTAQAHTHLVGVDDGGLNGISDPNDTSLINENASFLFQHQGETYDYTSDISSDTTLSSLAETINDDANGVLASVLNVGGSGDDARYVLSLSSESTGAGENLITQDGSVLGVNTGGASLFSSQTTYQEENRAGLDAEFTVNDISYTRSDNQVDDIIDGLTIELHDATAQDTTISVSMQTEAIVGKVQSFVQSYNQTQTFIDNKRSFDRETMQAGPLMGSSLARGVDSVMSRMLMEQVTLKNEAGESVPIEPFSYISQIGLQFQDDGSLQLNTEALTSAMAQDAQGIQELLSGENGAITKLQESLTTYTDSTDGMLTYKLENLDSRVDSIKDEIDEAGQELLEYRERITKKYAAMEQVILKYQEMGSQLSDILDFNLNSEKK